jgi:hypothetical protein
MKGVMAGQVKQMKVLAPLGQWTGQIEGIGDTILARRR